VPLVPAATLPTLKVPGVTLICPVVWGAALEFPPTLAPWQATSRSMPVSSRDAWATLRKCLEEISLFSVFAIIQ
jgi:hypothetical protein